MVSALSLGNSFSGLKAKPGLISMATLVDVAGECSFGHCVCVCVPTL